MSGTLKHGFVSPKLNGADTAKLRPSDWGNSETDYEEDPTHIFSGGALGSLLMRDTGVSDGASWLAAVAAGSYLRSAGIGSAPVWSTLTLPNSATVGDLFVATSANVMGSLAGGAAGTVLAGAGAGVVPTFRALTAADMAAMLAASNTFTLPQSIFGSTNATQFTVRANATQSNTNPLMSFRKSDGTMLFSLHSDSPFNVFVGQDSGAANIAGATGGSDGTALAFFGYQSGQFNTSGRYNAGFGAHALNANTSGNHNSAFGPNALLANTTGVGNTAVGAYALSASSTTGNSNTAVGYESQRTASGQFNVSLGMSSLKVASGSYNVSLGYNNMVATTTGHSNVAAGLTTLAGLTTGFGNVALGHYAGYGDVSDIANQHSVVDTYMVFLGFQASRDASVSSASVLTNGVAIGKNARVAASNSMVLGGTGSDAVNVGIGTVTPTSKLQVVGLSVFANNAAAISGGLTAGAFYRTGADPDPVCVVH